MNLSISVPTLAEKCNDLQIELCTKYDNNVLIPLIIAVGIISFRIFVLYNIKNKLNENLYYKLEFGLEYSTILLILTSILWILRIR